MIVESSLAIITILLLVTIILLRINLQRKEGTRVCYDRSIIACSYSMVFAFIALLFMLLLMGISYLVRNFPEYSPIWIFLLIFSCFLAISGAFVLSRTGDKDLHVLKGYIKAFAVEHAQPQKIYFPLPIIAVDVAEPLISGKKLSLAVKIKLFDQVSTLLQMGLIILITFHWLNQGGGNTGFVLITIGIGLLLVVSFTAFDVHKIQRAFGEQRYAEVFLSTFLIGICFSFLDFIGILMLINGIRMGVSLIKNIRTQDLSVDSLYINLNTFMYFHVLFLYLLLFYRPTLGNWDGFVESLFPGFIPMVLTIFLYWILIGRFISSRRFEFIGKRTGVVLGLVTSIPIGFGIPIIVIGLLKYFEDPLNAFFTRWRQNPELVTKHFKRFKGAPKNGQQNSKNIEKTTQQDKTRLETQKGTFKRRLLDSRKLRDRKARDQSRDKVKRRPLTTGERTARVAILTSQVKDLLQVIPKTAKMPLIDKVKFGVYVNEVESLQRQLNDFSPKPSWDPGRGGTYYIGDLPASMKGETIFVPSFYFAELVRGTKVLGANVPIIIVTPDVLPSIPEITKLIQAFLLKNQPHVSLNFIDPSDFDLHLYRHILKMFQPSKDAFNVAETIAYANALKIPRVLAPNLDWLFLGDLITSGHIPAKHLQQDFHFILLPQDALLSPLQHAGEVPTNVLPPSTVAQILERPKTPSYVSTRLSYIVTMTVFVLLMMAGVYFLLEQVGMAPVLLLSPSFPFTAQESVIIFTFWIGGIIFLSQYLFIKISNIRLRGVKW